MVGPGRFALLALKEVRFTPHQVTQLLKAVKPGIKVGLNLRQITPKRAEMRPSRIIAGLFQRCKDKRSWKRPCFAIPNRDGLRLRGQVLFMIISGSGLSCRRRPQDLGKEKLVTGMAKCLRGLLLTKAQDHQAFFP
jgi:hypothetical protein